MEITEQLKRKVWEQGREVEGYDAEHVRKDACDAYMIYEDYGEQTMFGWQIDHVCPKSLLEKLGYNEEEIWNIDNLRPMQWQNNLSKSDDYPSYMSAITSDGDNNIEREDSKMVNAKRRQKIQQLFPRLKMD